jgi:transposase-like protein
MEVDGKNGSMLRSAQIPKLLLEVDVYSRHGISPTAAFLHRLIKKHNVSDTEFLVDAGGYQTAPHVTN